MSDYDNWNDSETYPPAYGRPPAAAWIAAVAVAVAVIVAGGYIHTYRSFAAYKKWSVSELKKLNDELTALRTASRGVAGANAPGRRISGEPARRALGAGVPPTAERAARPTAADPLAPAHIQPSARESVSEDPGPASRPTITAESGLSSFFVGSRQAETSSKSSTRLRIIAVSKDQKRINMEGGRDQSLAEGDRLELSRDGRWIGDLRVITVFDNMAACEVLHSITMPEPGDLVRVPVGSASDSL